MNTKVILIEDDPDDQHLALHSLQAVGEGQTEYEVSRCANLKDGLAKIEEETPDAIILDLNLPDSQGTATLAAIVEAHPQIPVLVLTGGEGEDGLRALATGAQDFLLKEDLASQNLHRAVQFAIVRFQLSAMRDTQDERRKKDREWLASGAERGAPMTAGMIGVRDLREADPQVFQTIAKQFASILQQSLDEQRLKVKYHVTNQLRELAQELGRLRASHVDVVDIIRESMHDEANGDDSRSDWRLFEARHRGFQLMGFLAAYYRSQSMGK